MDYTSKPFTSYNGGKEADGTFQRIISIMPPHYIYIEPFLGNGAILRKKKPALSSSIGIDLDASVIQKWQDIQSKNKANDLPGCTFICADAIQWLENFIIPARILKNHGINILLYCDPPYPMNTRKSAVSLYAYEFTPMDHSRLLDVLLKLDANIIISSYPNRMYDESLTCWHSFNFNSTTRKGSAIEKVWYNFKPPTILHDYRFIGKDYRDRERIKGIISRTVSKFKRMPDLEKNYLLEKLKLFNNGSI